MDPNTLSPPTLYDHFAHELTTRRIAHYKRLMEDHIKIMTTQVERELHSDFHTAITTFPTKFETFGLISVYTDYTDRSDLLEVYNNYKISISWNNQQLTFKAALSANIEEIGSLKMSRYV